MADHQLDFGIGKVLAVIAASSLGSGGCKTVLRAPMSSPVLDRSAQGWKKPKPGERLRIFA